MKPQDNIQVEVKQDIDTSSDQNKSQDEDKFNNNFEYLMQTLGLAAGFGSIWRFPFLVYKNGGGVFLIPYFICIALITLPCYYLESAMGQIYQKGPMKLFPSFGQKYGGLGLFTIILTVLKAGFYNVFMTYSYLFFYYAFQSPLPWSSYQSQNGSQVNEKAFFNENIIKLTPSIFELGDYNPLIGIGYMLSYFVIWLCTCQGVKLSGFIATYSATAPFVILLIMAIRGFFLEGSMIGLEYLLKPNYEKLWTISLWTDAVGQALFQFSIGSGVIMLFGSYRGKRESLMQTSIFIPFMVCLCGFLSAVSVFQVVGYLSVQLKIDIKDIQVEGAELIFVIFPMALNMMPFKQLWAALFFFMMINLGLDTIMAYVEYISSLFETSEYFQKFQIRKSVSRGILCFALGLMGQMFCYGNGFYVTVFVNNFLTVSIVFSGLINPLFMYLKPEIYQDLERKIEKYSSDGKMNQYFKKAAIYVSCPCLIFLAVVSLKQMARDSLDLPMSYNIFGWGVVIFGPVIGMIYIYFAAVLTDQKQEYAKLKNEEVNQEIQNYGAIEQK